MQGGDQGATGRTDRWSDHTDRLTVREAAERLGITQDAVRSRIKRGTLRSEYEGGRVYVLVGDQGATDQPTDQPTDQDDHSGRIDDLREQVAYLREQLRREQDAHAEARRLLAGALERIPPQIEAPADAPADARGSPEAATEQPGRVGPQTEVEGPQEGAERVPWWRRVFGG
jgi:excisionase family DNA binding protein